jgi:acyl-CoA reductase-like NAD-dependent aldehyde dehydrogenase
MSRRIVCRRGQPPTTAARLDFGGWRSTHGRPHGLQRGCVIPYRDEAQAVEIANDTTYGLASYVLSSNLDRAKHVAEQLEAGRVAINGAPHEPLAPFGGFKQSGIGREYGLFGLESFLEPRAVLV